MAQANRDVQSDLQKLEVLKPRIKKKHERYQQLMRERDARRASASSTTTERSRSQEQKAPSHHGTHRRLLSDPAVTPGTEPLAAGDNRDLAVQLAHKEIKRRATARKATLQAGISEEVEQERRTAGVWGDWEVAFAHNDQGVDQDTLSKQMQSVRSQVHGSTSGEARNGRTLISRPSFESHGSRSRSSYQYPTVPEHSSHESWRFSPGPTSFLDDDSAESTPRSPLPPELPPKDYDIDTPRQSVVPSRPGKEALPSSHESPSRIETPPLSQPDLKPSTFTFKPSAYLENGNPLRTVLLPPDLRHRFLSIAEPNTRANLETCGILCGTLISNALFISKLVIPDQESTSDTCETINESELFDYVDGEDLMVLGWIHTHPTQTCFMSSRDLHTHGGYQVMMPESIAIVCAPSRGDWGVFRLTDPPGMKSVLNCTRTGLFHPHTESNIYTDASRPGHVFEAKGLEFEVVDLRPH